MDISTEIKVDSKEVDMTKHAAQKMLNEGNYLQSLEEFSKILVNHPNDQEALEGRISACLELKLFHRGLKDIETLSHINPCDTKIHSLAGQIYEQIGSNERSICAYLKAYLYERQNEIRLETVQKISKLCSILLREQHSEITGNIDGFQTLVLLSKKLAERENFQVCLEMQVTVIMAHCLNKRTSKAFKNELDICSKTDNTRNLPEDLMHTATDSKNIEACTFQQNIKHENTETKSSHKILSPMRGSKSQNEMINLVDRDCKLDTLSETPGKNNLKVETKTIPSSTNCQTNSLSCTKIETNVETLQTPVKGGKLNGKICSSVFQDLHSSNITGQTSKGVKNSENCFDHAELSDSLSKEPTQITFLPNTDPQTINDMLLQASGCCYKLGRVETSLWFSKKLLEHAQTSKDTITILKAYRQIGFLYSKYGDYESSVLYHTKVREKCREVLVAKNTLEQEMEISAIERENILDLCLLFKDLELYEQAEVFLKEFFSKVEVVGQHSLVKAYGVLGGIELAKNRYEEAIRSHRTQLALCLKYDDQKGLVLAYTSLGKAYQAFGNNVSAMGWFQLSLHTANSLNDPLCLATAYSCIGEGLLSQNNPQHALAYFEKQLDLSTAIDEQTLRIQALYSLGMTYQDLRLFQHAEFFLKRAILESKDLKMHLEEKIKESLVQVLLTLGKSREALGLLFEMRDTLEAKFQRVSGYRIVTSHPLLDKLNTCVDQILELLAEEGRLDEALQLAERTNSILLNQMLAYKAHVQGSEMVSTDKWMNLIELYQVVSDTNKVVLYYRFIGNGFMVWIIEPTHGIVHFHWFKAPCGASFEGIIEELMNGLLQPKDPLASYSCDHRKVFKDPQVTQYIPQSSTARSRDTPQGSPARSRDTPQGSTSKSRDTPQSSTSKSRDTPQGSTSKDFLRELSKLFIFPIEEALITLDLSSHDVVIINNSFLSMVPFPDLHISNGNTLAHLSNLVQLLPCISVLKILEKNEESPKGIAVIGNPEIRFPEILAGFQGHVQQDLLEQELNDVAVVTGTIPDVGSCATKEIFSREFNSTTLMHLSTYGSHENGTITLAPIPDIDPRVVTRGVARGVSRHPWEITLADIVAFRNAPEVFVLSSGSGCRNRFKELVAFNACLPLALMLAGVKTVVMATWSTPQNALLACLRQFYKNISDGLTVTCALSRAKTHVQEMEEFHEPLFWASFRVYGRDSLINVEEIGRSVAEESFNKAQEIAVERFQLAPHNEESSDGLVSQRLMETVIELLHRHHLHPDLLLILLQVTKEAVTMLQTPSNKASSASLPYREITVPWLSLILKAEKVLLSIGFLIKTTSSRQTILVYPHWNRNRCLEKVESLLRSVLDVLNYSPVLADALRVVLSQEKSLLVSLRDMLQKKLACPYEVVEICNTTLLRMFWLKRSTKRLMIELGFRQVGDILDFGNSKEDRNAIESCLNIFTLLTGFETSTEIQPHPMLSKVNLRASWMSYKVRDEENTARYLVAQSLDSIDAKYKLAMNDVRKWHNGVLLTQAKVTESKSQKAKLDHAKTISISNKQTETSKLPQIKNTKRQPLDLIKLGAKFTKIKVQSGAGPSSVRRPVEKEQPLPLVECMMKRHEATRNLNQCLGDMRDKRREEIRKLLSL